MKERLLMLCYRAPYPLRSGSEIRMYQYVEMLSDVYDIDLLYLAQHEEGDMTPLYQKCRKVYKFKVSLPKRILQTAAGYLFLGWPLQMGYFYSSEINRFVKKHIAEYDKVLCMHIRTMSYIMGLPTQKRDMADVYFDGIDAITLNYKGSYEKSKGIRRWINKLEYKRMSSYEKKVYEKANKSILISERDRDYIVNTLGAKCDPAIIYNYAVDFGYRPEIKPQKRVVAFMGKMNYAPNVDAVMCFSNQVFGQLKEKYPDLEFWILGGFATKEVQELAKRDGIKLLGFVENPAENLQQATMVIAPMVSGSGLQNKIVQAMYLAAPVITTPIGANGLYEVSEKEICVADFPEEYAKKLEYYLQDEMLEERTRMGRLGREYIQKYYSYEGVKKQVLAFFGIKE